jgi:hypothetical protein
MISLTLDSLPALNWSAAILPFQLKTATHEKSIDDNTAANNELYSGHGFFRPLGDIFEE